MSLGESPMPEGNSALYSSPRLRSLLGYLLLHRDAPQARQHLAFLLWPDSSEEQALSNLRNLLFQLRRAVPATAHYLRVDRTTLQWQGDAGLELDVLQFERALSEAEQAAHENNARAQAVCLQRAIDLYKGDLLPSAYEDWVLVERERLQQRFTSALESLITLFERQGNVQGAIEASQRLLRHNPLHEAAYTQLLELYAASGMVAQALRIYHTCATTLERELGVEPSANTREAYERVLSSRQPARIRTAEPGARKPSTLEQPALRVATPLTGRATEWALLQEAWREATQGRTGSGARVVLVRGEAGIGKTRLIEELFNWVTRQGVAVASARCYPIERRLAFGPVSDWLRALPTPPLAPVWLSEVARLRPGILEESPGTPAPGPLTEAWQRLRFMEAISRALLTNQPLLLTLDDLQWCDSDTLEYLHFMIRYDTEARLLLVMAARIEEIDATPDTGQAQGIAHILDDLRDTERLLEIDLAPLSQGDTAELATALSGGRELDPTRLSELYRETEGNPLFIVEMLRTAQTRNAGSGMLNAQIGVIPHYTFRTPHSEGLPPRMARVLKDRLGQLSPEARELVDVAAVIGRDFTLPLLKLAGNRSESAVVQALDELWRRRIVREQGEEGYDFSHDKLRQAAYSMLTSAKRRMLHRTAASALEQTYADRLELVYAQLGMHYETAGDPLPASRYYRQAAEAALRLYANAEAIPLYERAFAMAQQFLGAAPNATSETTANEGEEARERVVEAGESLADLLQTTGNHVRARSTYETALAVCPAERSIWKARLLLKIGDTWRAQREFDRATEFYDALDKMLGSEPYEPEEIWWDVWIEGMIGRMMLHYWQREPDEMLKVAGKVEQAVDRHGTPLQKVKYYRALASMHLRWNRYRTSDECLRCVSAAFEETRELNNLTEMTDSTFLMGFCTLWRGDLPSAVDYLREALSLAERTAMADYKLLSLAYLSIAYRMQGNVERTREVVAQHIAFMDSVQSPSYRETAEANLAWIAWKDGDPELAESHALAALAKFSDGESFTWLATWPLVAASLATDNLSEAVRFAAAQLAPAIQRAPEELITAVRGAVDAWARQLSDRAAVYLRRALELAHECSYI